MAVVYGQRLPDVGSVEAYSNRLRAQKLQEAQQVRVERKAAGERLAARQQADAEARYSPVSTKARKATKGERAIELALEEKAKSTKEWKAWMTARAKRGG